MKKRLYLLLFCFLWASSAQAIVNIEAQKKLWPKKGLSGSVSLDSSQTGGNKEQVKVRVSSKIDFVGEQNRSFIIMKRSYAETNDVASDDSAFAHLRFIVSYQKPLAYEAFIQKGHNPFLSLPLRQLVGGGLRFLMAGSDASYAQFLGIGIFIEEEKYDDNDTIEENVTLVRMGTYWRFRFISDDTRQTLNNTVYFQPATSDPTDYRLSSDLKWTVDLTETLSFYFNASVKKDSQPWGDDKALDTTFKNGLKYSF